MVHSTFWYLPWLPDEVQWPELTVDRMLTRPNEGRWKGLGQQHYGFWSHHGSYNVNRLASLISVSITGSMWQGIDLWQSVIVRRHKQVSLTSPVKAVLLHWWISGDIVPRNGKLLSCSWILEAILECVFGVGWPVLLVVK